MGGPNPHYSLECGKKAPTGFVGQTNKTHLDPQDRTVNGESIVSVSKRILVKQQGCKQQKQMNHGVDHKRLKLW